LQLCEWPESISWLAGRDLECELAWMTSDN
jgi:hypothetical protein